jgi:hypothetical protein
MDITPKQFNSLLGELKKIREHLEQLHKDRQEQAATDNATKERREQDRKAQPLWLDPILTKYKQPESDRKTESNRQYSVQNSMRWAGWFTFAATLLAFAAAAIYAHYAKGQLKAAQDTLTQIISADRPWVAPFRSAGEAAVNFTANGKAVDRGRNIILSSVSMTLHNSGKSPAYIESISLGFNHYQKFPENPEPTQCSQYANPEVRTIIPNGEVAVSCTNNGQEKRLIDWYAFGSVEYTDIRTKRRYYTHLCYQYVPSTNGFTKPCDTYNDAN